MTSSAATARRGARSTENRPQWAPCNGTAGLEIIEDLPDVDAVIAPVGGGGLLTGIGVVFRALKPAARVYAAEPETAAPLRRSMDNGKASRFDEWTVSFVDGAGGKSV